MSNRLNLNSKLFKAHQTKGNPSDLLLSIEKTVDENLNDSSKLSEVLKNVPGGALVKMLSAEPLCLPIG